VITLSTYSCLLIVIKQWFDYNKWLVWRHTKNLPLLAETRLWICPYQAAFIFSRLGLHAIAETKQTVSQGRDCILALASARSCATCYRSQHQVPHKWDLILAPACLQLWQRDWYICIQTCDSFRFRRETPDFTPSPDPPDWRLVPLNLILINK